MADSGSYIAGIGMIDPGMRNRNQASPDVLKLIVKILSIARGVMAVFDAKEKMSDVLVSGGLQLR